MDSYQAKHDFLIDGFASLLLKLKIISSRRFSHQKRRYSASLICSHIQ